MKYDWELKGNDSAQRGHWAASTIAQGCRAAITEHYEDVSEKFSVFAQYRSAAHFDQSGWCVVSVQFDAAIQIPIIDKLSVTDADYFREFVSTVDIESFEPSFESLTKSWLSASRFTYIGPHSNGWVNSEHFHSHANAWLVDICVPSALEKNRSSILRALPKAPNYDLDVIAKSLWVLECEESCSQGTAFDLENYGCVSCAHVIGPTTNAFRHSMRSIMHTVIANRIHDIIDLAVFGVGETERHALPIGDPQSLKQMDHLLIAGHPNFRPGDSPIIVPGLVSGFRMASGIRRILTNAPIVSGCSGGPVLNAAGEVIGVAVTGGDSVNESAKTEDLGIVPIDALELLP